VARQQHALPGRMRGRGRNSEVNVGIHSEQFNATPEMRPRGTRGGTGDHRTGGRAVVSSRTRARF
jgi:hypothetical protein